MALDPWVYAAAFGLALTNLLVVAFVARRRAASPGDDGRADGAGGSAVECSQCGAKNESEYRFCRRCVAELPGAAPSTGPGPAPSGRGIL